MSDESVPEVKWKVRQDMLICISGPVAGATGQDHKHAEKHVFITPNHDVV